MKNVGYNLRDYLQPAFLICVAVLVTGEVIKPILGAVIPEKEPFPLKKPLDLLDEEKLIPYRVISKSKIQNEEIVKELGTKDYIQWVLEDTNVADDSFVKRFLLFITYYELPDRVPHVPEECYTGGGYQRLTSDSVTLEIQNPNFEEEIRGKYLVFGRVKADLWQSGGKFPVLYLFRVNGVYAGSRDEARMALNKNFLSKYSYFSKVELVFNQMLVTPSKQDVVKASEKLLAVILSILEKEHWPDG